jgi:hypothetical protein
VSKPKRKQTRRYISVSAEVGELIALHSEEFGIPMSQIVEKAIKADPAFRDFAWADTSKAVR